MEEMEEFSEKDFEVDEEIICPNCDRNCGEETICPHCGAMLSDDDELDGFVEEESY